MLSMMNTKASVSRYTLLIAVIALGCWSANLWAAPGGNGNGVGNGGRPPGAEPEEGVGNNLSNPVLFPEGHGLLGLPVSEGNLETYADTGLRGGAEIADLGASLPYFREVASEGPYLQSVPEFVWQAQWEDRSGDEVGVTADWSDNLVRQQWTTQSVVRVEMVLTDLLQGVGDGLVPGEPASEEQLRLGYPMVSLGGTKKDEVWAASSSTPTLQNPTVYSIVPRLTISKLSGDQIDGEHGDVVIDTFDESIYESFGTTGPGGFSAEVNASGKVIYGFNWNLRNETVPNKAGWWRLSFSLDDEANYTLLDEEGEPSYVANVGRNTILSNLHPFDTQDYWESLPEEGEVVIAAEGETSPLLFEPVLAEDGFSTYLDVFLSTQKSGKGQGGGKKPTTSLEGTMSFVPEPSSVMALCIGVSILVMSGRTLRRKQVE